MLMLIWLSEKLSQHKKMAHVSQVGSMRGSLALMAGGLVISFLGLLTCLLLVTIAITIAIITN